MSTTSARSFRDPQCSIFPGLGHTSVRGPKINAFLATSIGFSFGTREERHNSTIRQWVDLNVYRDRYSTILQQMNGKNENEHS